MTGTEDGPKLKISVQQAQWMEQAFQNIQYLASNLHWFLLAVGPIVIFHELGHFLFAKLFDVKVLRFSVGFGPMVMGFRKGETEYRISLLPLGGYVQMLGEFPGAEIDPEDTPRTFEAKPAWQRALILLAGPGFNVLLTLVLATGLNMERVVGQAKFGEVVSGGPAWNAGIRPGDQVTAVNGQPIHSADDFRDWVIDKAGVPLSVQYLRDGQSYQTTITPASVQVLDPTGTRTIGRVEVSWVYTEPLVGIIDTQSPAAQAGLQTGDRIVAVNTKPVTAWHEVRTALEGIAEGEKVSLRVQRIVTASENRSKADAKQKARSAQALTLELMPSVTTDPAKDAVTSANTPWGYTGLVALNAVIRQVEPETPTAAAGLQPGDRLLSLGFDKADGTRHHETVNHWNLAVQALDSEIRMQDKVPETLYFKYQRGTQIIETQASTASRFEPLAPQERVFILGAVPYAHSSSVYTQKLQRSVSAALWEASLDLVEVFKMFGKLLTGQIANPGVGGMATIIHMTAQAAQQGAVVFIGGIANLSISIGLLNLLPIPVLDGGRLLMVLIEMVRRRPLSMQSKELAMRFGVALILALMIYVITKEFWIFTMSDFRPS